MHRTDYPGGQRWVKVNTAATLNYSVTSVLHNEVKEYGFYVLIWGQNLLCVKMKLDHHYSLLLQ